MRHLTSLPTNSVCTGCNNAAKWDHFNTTFQLGRWEEGASAHDVTAALDCLLAFSRPLCQVHWQMLFPKFAFNIDLVPDQGLLSAHFPAQIVACHLNTVIPQQQAVVNDMKTAAKTETRALTMLHSDVKALQNQLDLVESRTKLFRALVDSSEPGSLSNQGRSVKIIGQEYF